MCVLCAIKPSENKLKHRRKNKYVKYSYNGKGDKIGLHPTKGWKIIKDNENE